MLEDRIDELKAVIAGNDGHNAADRRFARAVDELMSAVYDDIGAISGIGSRALFDLFLIKVLYVGRRSSDARVLDYLGALLARYLYARELYAPSADGETTPKTLYFSDALAQHEGGGATDRFGAYRRYADTALFLSGVFPPRAPARPRRGRKALQRRPAGIDQGYYVTTGKRMYRLAAHEDAADRTRQRETLLKLAEYFELYVDALNEMSERYILGFDLDLITDKMLDSFNRYRQTGDARALEHARVYASILCLDQGRFPALFPSDADRR
ncbi:MAG: hypothetical protein IVW36_03980 [Dehalococcoidia bacterium]|nr:hypothetical protein [Dehalococcoidia bacterium]